MTPPRLAPFVLGCIAMASLAVSIFFVRYYRETRDTLFLFFAAAFGIEAITRTLLTFQPAPNEALPHFYVLRAFAYSLILIGIYRKNR